MSRTFQKFLVPVDLSLHSQEALQCAAALATRVEATLLVLHIIGNGNVMLRRGAGTWDIIGKTTKLENLAVRSARYGGPRYVP